jgi:hypothetical protein
LIAENYKFRVAERRTGTKAPPPTPKTLTSILLSEGHPPQIVRTTHFLPRSGDVIPEGAEVFNFDLAIQERQSRIDLYREMTLSKAEFLCDSPPPETSRRAAPKIPVRRRRREKSKIFGLTDEEFGFVWGVETVISKTLSPRRAASELRGSEPMARRAVGRPLSAQAKRPGRKTEKFDGLVRPVRCLSSRTN